MEEKWYNIELSKEEWEDFREVLKRDEKESGIHWYYEASEVGNWIHIEIKCMSSELHYLNELLMKIF